MHNWASRHGVLLEIPFDESSATPQPFPKAKVYARSGHYEKALRMYNRSDMLLWTLCTPESLAETKHANAMTMRSFSVAIESMLHNIHWPPHFIKLFPLQTMQFGNLPGELKRFLRKKFNGKPKQDEQFRPYQKTVAMGFKWAVYVAHSFASFCIKEAMSPFSKLSPSLSFHHTISIADKYSGIVRLTQGDAVFLHIIDDVNFVANGWPPRGLSILQRIL